MFGLSIALLVVPILAVIGLVAAVRSRPVIRIGHNDHVRLAALQQQASRRRLGGLVIGLVGAVACASAGVGALGRIAALAPAVFVGCLLVGTIVGELTAHAPHGMTRQASVTSRRVADLLGRGWVVTAGVAAAFLLLVLGIGTLLASPDDMGQAGRNLARTCTEVVNGTEATIGFSRGPWPGSFYTVPLGIAAVVLVLLAGLALRAITLRRSAGLTSEALDHLTRRWAAGNVLLACTVGFLLIAGPLAMAMGGQLLSVDTCRRGGDAVLGWGFFLGGNIALGSGLSLIGALLLGPRLVVDDLPGALPTPPTSAGVPVR